MKKKQINIKSLTSELKNHITHKEKSTKVRTAIPEEKKKNTDSECSMKPTDNSRSSTQFKELGNRSEPAEKLIDIVNKVNAMDHYKIDRFIYVDADIHEVFTKLKSQTKLKISHLASYLLEEFIHQHKEAIIEIANKRNNKFLDT